MVWYGGSVGLLFGVVVALLCASLWNRGHDSSAVPRVLKPPEFHEMFRRSSSHSKEIHRNPQMSAEILDFLKHYVDCSSFFDSFEEFLRISRNP